MEEYIKRHPELKQLLEDHDKKMAEIQEGFQKELYDGYDTKEEWLEAYKAKMKAKLDADNERMLRGLFGK